jgi:hypothetical protein
MRGVLLPSIIRLFGVVLSIGATVFVVATTSERSRVTPASTVTSLRAGRPEFDSRQSKIFLFAIMSILAVRSTQPVGTGVLPSEYSGRGVKLTTHLHLVPKLRMCGAIPQLIHSFAWHGA